MARPNYGPQAQKRARHLFETLVAFANDEFEDCDALYSKIKTNWQTSQQLVIRTKIRYITSLTGKDPHPSKLTADHIKESLKRFNDYLEILEDNRTSTQGSDTWHFTLNLWYPRYETERNLKRFDQEWQARRPSKSKQATAVAEAEALKAEGIQPQNDDAPIAENSSAPSPSDPPPKIHNPEALQDWGQAIDVSTFYGRTDELTQLQQWVMDDRCRLISILGMGGIGKTALSVKLAENCQDNFEYLIWRSLRNAPPILELLADLIQFLSGQQETDLPDSLDGRLRRLMHYLQTHCCLLVLDNVESILSEATSENQRTGAYRKGYEGYGQLLRSISETPHPSCIIITSREKPGGMSSLEGQAVRSLPLKGLAQSEGQAVLASRGMSASAEQAQALVERYGGNPLALQVVATTIQELFASDIATFLAQGSAIFGDISDLLEQQIGRISELEQQVMYWLAICRDWVPIQELQESLVPAVAQRALLEAIDSLQRRSLIENRKGQFTQQPVVMEYVTEQLIEQVSHELLQPLTLPETSWFNRYALTQALTQDYLRQAQVQLILRPICDHLLTRAGHPKRLEQALWQQLQPLKSGHALFPTPGYAAGNLLKLLDGIGADLTGRDFSNLCIWQVYLQDMDLHRVDFSQADFRKTVFAQIAKRFVSAVFSPDGKQLATGVDTEILFWDVEQRSPVNTFAGHTGWVTVLAFSPDGQWLASASSDETLRLWNIETGQCLKTLRGLGGRVGSIAFHPKEQLFVAGGADGQIHCWDIQTQERLQTLEAHGDRIFSVAFTSNGQWLVSSSQDGTVRRWSVGNPEAGVEAGGVIHTPHEQEIKTLVNWSLACGLSPDGQRLVTGSEGEKLLIWDWNQPQEPLQLNDQTYVWATAFSPDGQQVVTASKGGELRLWDANTGQGLRSLRGHQQQIWLAAFSPQGQQLVSCSDDQTLKLWQTETGQCLGTIKTYNDAVMAVAFSPEGNELASGSEDGEIRVWDVGSGSVQKTLSGHRTFVGAIAFSAEGDRLVSGSDDATVKLWEVKTGKCISTLYGHRGSVLAVAFDPLNRFVASAGQDCIIRLWDEVSGECLHALAGHGQRVKAIAFTPDGKLLASGSDDQSIKLWDLETYDCVATLTGHEGWVVSLAFVESTPHSGYHLASASADQTARIWEVKPGRRSGQWQVKGQQTLEGHGGAVRSVVFSADGQQLVTGSADHQLKIWEVKTGDCLRSLLGHEDVVWSVDWATESDLLASGSEDGTIRFWNHQTGDCERILMPQRPYEGMKITGATGLSEAQRETLQALGAIDG